MFLLIPLSPNQAVQTFKEYSGYLEKFGQIGGVKKALAYAGNPICDLKKTYNLVDKKNQDNIVINFLKRHVGTYGVIAGVLLFFSSGFLGKYAASSGEEGLGKLGWLSKVGRLLSIGSLVASVFSSAKGIPRDIFIDPVERLILQGKNFLDGVLKPFKEEPKTLSDNILRFPSDVNTAIDQKNLYTSLDEGKQVFLVGVTQTGKTSLCHQVIGMIVNHENNKPDGKKREVLTHYISGKDLIKVFENPDPTSEVCRNIASQFGQGFLSELLGSSTSKLDMLRGIARCLKKKFDEGRADNNKRFVLLLDEFDEIMALAKDDNGKPQTEMMDTIFSEFAALLDDKSNDIFFTSNKTLEDMCGFGVNPETKETTLAKGTNAEKFFGRMHTILIEVKIPDEIAKSKIIKVYLDIESKKDSNRDLYNPQFLSSVSLDESNLNSAGNKVLSKIDELTKEAKNADNNPQRWAIDTAKEIIKGSKNNKNLDLTLLRLNTEKRIQELRGMYLKYESYKTIAGGFIKPIIENLIKNAKETKSPIDETMVANFILGHPPEPVQVRAVDNQISKLKELLYKKINDCLAEEDTSNKEREERVEKILRFSEAQKLPEIRDLIAEYAKTKDTDDRKLLQMYEIETNPNGKSVVDQVIEFCSPDSLSKVHIEGDSQNTDPIILNLRSKAEALRSTFQAKLELARKKYKAA